MYIYIYIYIYINSYFIDYISCIIIYIYTYIYIYDYTIIDIFSTHFGAAMVQAARYWRNIGLGFQVPKEAKDGASSDLTVEKPWEFPWKYHPGN